MDFRLVMNIRTKIPLKSAISEGFFLFFVFCGANIELVILNI